MNRAAVTCEYEITGRLLENAEARHRAIEGGPIVPVLCFSVQTLTATGGICRVQQLFGQGQEAQCEARAKELLKDAVVVFQAPSVGIELIVHNAHNVHQVSEAPAPEPEAAHA